jgi:hypothetical protein
MTVATTEVTGVVVPVVSDATMALFAQMAVNIPEADDGGAYEAIVLTLLQADDVDGLNAPWDTSKAEALAGHRLRIETITRRPSDFNAGLGLYLVAQGTDMNTGEKFTWSSGSVSVVAQLARAHFLNAFPVIAELIISDTPTKSGFRPQRLQVLSFGGSK